MDETSLTEEPCEREALNKACMFIEAFLGTCPYDHFDCDPWEGQCSIKCNDVNSWECWVKYFLDQGRG